ncbi:protein kinase C theta type-like [Ranitomeya variabilis]|uniref:protein kinase C theta type-like n=1 Tax=Ranitomeya variabilis TaxID=490064 RepID=UPI0040575425
MATERRRAQRDRVLRERRVIHEELVFFALGRSDIMPPDMDTDATKMASKRQHLDMTRKTKRQEILSNRRKMETPMEFSDDEIQRAIPVSLKKIGKLATEIRKRNKEAILNKRRNISAEINLDEVLQGTHRQVSSRAESQDTPNLQRTAAKERMRNNRDWAVQCRRHLTYASPIINGNGALCGSWPSTKTISIPDFLFHLSDSSPERSMEEDEPDGSDKMPPDSAVTPVEDPTDVSSLICPIREINPINLCHLVFHKNLGEGCFGKVILASDPDTDEMLAIKKIAKSSCHKETITKEIDILRMAFGCPFITTLRGCVESPTEYIIAMEYVVGRDLYGHLAQSISFDMETSRLFAAEMICGIQFLHEHGVIHCDLKPQNVLIDDMGHIRISDFGASAVNVAEDDLLYGFVGSQGYIAPEIMDGKGFNYLADSFSFGVIMYIMIVGTQPFYSRGTLEQYHLSLWEDDPYFPPWMPIDAHNILEGLLCKTPTARYPITSFIREQLFFLSINWSYVESGTADPPFRWGQR